MHRVAEHIYVENILDVYAQLPRGRGRNLSFCLPNAYYIMGFMKSTALRIIRKLITNLQLLIFFLSAFFLTQEKKSLCFCPELSTKLPQIVYV